MEYRRLFVFLEGERDIRFFNKTIKCLFEYDYHHINVVSYRTKTKKRIKGFISTINHNSSWDYIYFRDMDESPCVSAVLVKIKNSCDYINLNSVIIIICEIESWYLAGLDRDSSQTIGIPNIKNTESVSKEKFENLFNKNMPINPIIEKILELWSYEVAIKKNRSVRYFYSKFGDALNSC